MRILRLVRFFYAGPRENLKDNPNESYAQAKRRFEESGFLYSSALPTALGELGAEADQLYTDSDGLQRKWAAEKGLLFETREDKVNVVLKQIEEYRPDVLYFQDDQGLPEDVRKNIKARFPFVKKVLMFKGFPQNIDRLSDIDHLFAGVPEIVDLANKHGVSTELMYHFFDAQFLSKISPSVQKIYPATFIGSSGIGQAAHRTRYWMLFRLLRETPLQAWLDEPGGRTPFSNNPLVDKWATQILNNIELGAIYYLPERLLFKMQRATFLPIIKKLGDRGVERQREEDILINEINVNNRNIPRPRTALRFLFSEKVKPSIFGLDMYQVMADSLVTFNVHTEAVRAVVGNMRMFEATGVGSCLLTNTAENMKDLFEADSEVVTYKSEDECIEKLKYLIEHPREAQEIAQRGQARTLKSHTAAVRAQQILEFLRNSI